MACMSHPASTMLRMLGAKNMASSSGCAVSTTARGLTASPASAESWMSLLVWVVHCRSAANKTTRRARIGLAALPEPRSGRGTDFLWGLSSSAAMSTSASSGCSSTSGSRRDAEGGDAGTRRRSIEMCRVRVIAGGQLALWNNRVRQMRENVGILPGSRLPKTCSLRQATSCALKVAGQDMFTKTGVHYCTGTGNNSCCRTWQQATGRTETRDTHRMRQGRGP